MGISHRFKVATALAALSLVIAACGSDDSDSAATTAITDPPAVTESAATDPPATEPPATDPPATEPPATDPPATEPDTTEPPATEPPATEPPVEELTFQIAGIEDGGTVPAEMACDQANMPPVVTIESVPEGTMEFVFIVDDPDAPTTVPFTHWVVYGIPATTSTFTDAEAGLTYGNNDAEIAQWIGPCPPEGDAPHEYVFRLVALDTAADLAPGLDARAVADAIDPFVLATAEVTSTYAR
ncbi:MAG: YbhB/YbcL family Raf kinase inhibitor-like protein [Actinomycetota bacterium]